MGEGLSAQEELDDCAVDGRACDLTGRPEDQRRVAADVLADLCRGERGDLHGKGLRLRGAVVVGDLDLERATLPVPLQLTACEVRGAVDLTEASVPLVLLDDSHIAGRLRAGGLRTRSLTLRGAVVDGPVDLRGAAVEGYLSLERASLGGADVYGIALDARGMRVGGTVRFDHARSGPVRFIRADVATNLEMDGTELTGADAHGYSLDIRGLHVAGATFFREGFATTGAIRAVGAAVDGGLYLSEAEIGGVDDEGIAFQARGLRTNGSITADAGLDVAGCVCLEGTTVLGEVRLDGMRIHGCDPDGTALDGTGMEVGGPVRLEGLRTDGAVRLSDAVIGGSLSLRGARLAGRVDKYGNSLASDGVRVGRSLHLSEGFSAVGEVRLVGATVEGQLCFERAERFPLLALRGARCAELADTSGSWPAAGNLELRGFRFDGLKLDVGPRERLDWVRRQGYERWSPDPYEQLAGYYGATGDEDAARRIRVAQHDDELTHLRTTRGLRSLGYRMWRRPLGWLVGHGYQRHRTAWLLAVTILLAGGLFRVAENDGAMVPHEEPPASEACGADHPCFNSWVYGADVVLPIIDFGQDTAWRPVETEGAGPAWLWARWAFIALGWVLASVFVAAFTGIVQKS